jgi:Ca2+-binding EF-hand superfamily protein
VSVNFSREQLERLDEYLHRYGEDRGGFIRRATLEKLAQLGFGLNQKSLGSLIQEARDDSQT